MTTKNSQLKQITLATRFNPQNLKLSTIQIQNSR